MAPGICSMTSSRYALSTRSTLFKRTIIGTYDLLSSMQSMNWSTLTSSLKRTSALWIPYSLITERIVFSSIWVRGIVEETWTPPFLVFLILTSGLVSLGLTPTFLSSLRIVSNCLMLNMSKTTMIKSAVLATERISLPLPFPLAAPVMIPGISKICIWALLYSIIPGIISKVVNS